MHCKMFKSHPWPLPTRYQQCPPVCAKAKMSPFTDYSPQGGGENSLLAESTALEPKLSESGLCPAASAASGILLEMLNLRPTLLPVNQELSG